MASLQPFIPPPTDLRPEASAAELVREALDETKQLVKLEVELAKDELRHDLAEAKRAAIMFGVAAVAALLAAAMMFVALALAIFPGPVPALVIGGAAESEAALLRTMVPLRAHAGMLVVANGDEYVEAMLSALRAS